MCDTVVVPFCGESFRIVTLDRWHKAPGDMVEEGEVLCELDTDKIIVEVHSPRAGKLVKRFAAAGAQVKIGELLAEIC